MFLFARIRSYFFSFSVQIPKLIRGEENTAQRQIKSFEQEIVQREKKSKNVIASQPCRHASYIKSKSIAKQDKLWQQKILICLNVHLVFNADIEEKTYQKQKKRWQATLLQEDDAIYAMVGRISVVSIASSKEVKNRVIEREVK